MLPSLLSEIGIEFNTVDEAWMFWIRYGGQKGFEVRKKYTNKRKTQRLLAAHLAFWREEEPSAAAYLQDEQWVAAIVLVGSSIDHK